MKRILASVLFFYVLALIQTSFIFHLGILNVVPNLILISVVLLTFFERADKKTGLAIAGIGGFFLDLFSYSYLGISIILLIILVFLLKKFLKISAGRNIIHLVLALVFSIVFYNLFLVLLDSIFLDMSFLRLFIVNRFLVFESMYTLGVGILFYFLIKCSKKALGK